MTCDICKQKQGSCIDCDYNGCKKSFHVRCAIKKGFILSFKEMESKMKVKDWDIKVYCTKHQSQGKRKVKRAKETLDAPVISSNIIYSDEEDQSTLLLRKVETRMQKEKKQINKAQPMPRKSVLQSINLDRVLDDEKSVALSI